MSDRRIEPCFLGPYGENDDLLERLVVEFLRDHVYWRRNFHPEDPPPIPTGARYDPQYEAFVGRMRRELHTLTALLKRSVPFFSPRYLGHMVSDVLLPGLVAQIATLPYNPNNVVDEASPVTIDLELDAGLQLAGMVGYETDERRTDCAFGYLASGGTVANYQALRALLAIKLYPLAVRAACDRTGHDFPWRSASILAWEDRRLIQLAVPDVIALREAFEQSVSHLEASRSRAVVVEAVVAERAERLGLVEFFRRHPDCPVPRLLVPVTAHYSWDKAMKLIGLGTRQIDVIPEVGMRMDVAALENQLARCVDQHQPIVGLVGVLGTTEFGTLDPIDALVEARDRFRSQGLGFGVHVDAAWGGYVASLMRDGSGQWLNREEVAKRFRYFPSARVHRAVTALSRADSITVDPHKLGYLPYGAGAYLCRDQRMMDFLAQDADYVFERSRGATFREKFRGLGKYIMEGSKSGATAAAVWVTHRTLPLDADHFGLIPAETIRASESFWDEVRALADRLSGRITVTIPFAPDTNLVCVAINPHGNRSVGAMNHFAERVFDRLRVERQQPLQIKQFFGSTTRLTPEALGAEDTARILRELDLEPTTLRDHPRNEGEAASLLILRHTLMNPWLLDRENDVNYIRKYIDYLESVMLEVRAAEGAPG